LKGKQNNGGIIIANEFLPRKTKMAGKTRDGGRVEPAGRRRSSGYYAPPRVSLYTPPFVFTTTWQTGLVDAPWNFLSV
jgi:hypothetical protein